MFRSLSRVLALAALTFSSLAPAAAQAQAASPILGTWTLDWESGRRIENDDVTIIRSTGTIVIASSGDSLVATITTLTRSGGAAVPAPVTLRGRMTATGASFQQANEVRMNMNGEERVQTIMSTWTLSADGDQLAGTIAREMPGMPMAPEPAVVTGKRVR